MTAKDVGRGKAGRVSNVSGSTSNQRPTNDDSRSPSCTPNFTESSEGEDQEMEIPTPTEGGQVVPHVSTDHRLELAVGKRWFGDGSIVRAITHCIRSQYTEASTCWSKTPQHVRDMWFKNFKRRYTWKAELESEVRKGFNAVGQKRLKQMISNAGRGDEPPAWMAADLHKSLRKIRETTEFKAKSKRARKNRISNLADENGKIDPGHRQGSMSTATLASRMAKKNKNKLPLAKDLYVQGHSTKDKDGKSVIVGKKAQEIKMSWKKRQAKPKQRHRLIQTRFFMRLLEDGTRGLFQGLEVEQAFISRGPNLIPCNQPLPNILLHKLQPFISV